MLKIKDHVSETSSTKTIRFYEWLEAVPGQFVMVWVPGVDEFPMSVSYSGNSFGITYQIVGDGTRALAKKTPGERIGIRGPYGRGFSLSGKRLLLVAGGLGMAPIAPLVDQAMSRGCSVDLVIGAKSAKELLFERRVTKVGANVHISTDDGTKGFKGFASDLADSVIRNRKVNHIYTCGPEKMIVKVMDLASRKKIPMQASLERMMKCGIGVCDSCALDGRHVCRDGPVFSLKELRSFEDFGKTKLDQAGRKVPI